MKKSILALLLAVLMVASLLPAAALADETVASTYDLAAEVAKAQDGDTISIPAGVYDIGDVVVNKVVNIKGAGADSTTLLGSITTRNFSSVTTQESMTIEGITFKSNTKAQQAVCWGSATSGSNNEYVLDDLELNFVDCKVVDFLFAIGVNSGTKNCTLNVQNLVLENVWCGANVSEGAGNTVGTYDIAAGSNVVYAIQVFSGSNYNCYYETVEKWEADTTHSNADLTSNDNMPSISAGNWPAAAEVDGKYYGTIQKAVDAASDNDVITIMPGTHTLADNETITIDKKVTIQGDGVSSTVVGSGSSSAGHGLFTFAAGSEGSTLKDFEIKYTATAADCAAVYFGYGFTGGSEDSVTTIENVDFIGANSLDTIGQEMGILSTYMTGSNITIKNCDFYNFKYAMYFNAVKGLTVTGNTIDGTKYNAINIAGDNPAVPCADISVSGNTLRNICSADYYSEEYSSGIRIGVNATDVHVANNSITMLNGKTPVYYEPDTSDDPVRFIVKYVSDNAVIDMYTVDADANTISLNGAPSKSGYAFLGWSDGTTTYAAGAQYTVTADTTFTASWVRHPDTEYVPEPEEPKEPEVPEFPFYDVPTSAWYYTAVKYVYDNKLMDGVDTYVFAPNDTLTRAMVWTIIARMSGVDTTGGNTWYAKAQEWVITNGISDGENPTAAITRQELVTMLYRYAQIKGYDVSVGEDTNILSYVDATSISEYAMSAFQWACGSGLTEGDENGALTPLATATRAQAAAMIMRFLSK